MKTPKKVDPKKQPRVRTSVFLDADLFNGMIDLIEQNKEIFSGPQTLGQICEASIEEYFQNHKIPEVPKSIKQGYRQFGD